MTNPSATDSLDTPGVVHHVQHDFANDAIEALETKVGINNSTDVNSLDYKMTNLAPFTLATVLAGMTVTVPANYQWVVYKPKIIGTLISV